jgi:outer membrane protein OmpA-like peptidoglycan-associated protein
VKRFLALVLFVALAGCAATGARPAAAPVEGDQFAVFFKENSAALTPEGQEVIGRVVDRVHKAHPSGIVVVGQADGATARDADLAATRARTVADALVARGIAERAIEIRAGPAPTGENGVAAHKVIVRLSAG